LFREEPFRSHASAGTLDNLFPAASPISPVCPKTINAVLIPVYNADGSLYAWASAKRFARLQSAGLIARVVCHRKGRINRAILVIRPGEPTPLLAGSVMGIRYSFKERLAHGPAWELKRLGGARDGKTYAPASVRDAFLQVVADCTVP
jgi:hypothetical protein